MTHTYSTSSHSWGSRGSIMRPSFWQRLPLVRPDFVLVFCDFLVPLVFFAGLRSGKTHIVMILLRHVNVFVHFSNSISFFIRCNVQCTSNYFAWWNESHLTCWKQCHFLNMSSFPAIFLLVCWNIILASACHILQTGSGLAVAVLSTQVLHRVSCLVQQPLRCASKY